MRERRACRVLVKFKRDDVVQCRLDLHDQGIVVRYDFERRRDRKGSRLANVAELA
jgi:hypothetical protein